MVKYESGGNVVETKGYLSIDVPSSVVSIAPNKFPLSVTLYERVQQGSEEMGYYLKARAFGLDAHIEGCPEYFPENSPSPHGPEPVTAAPYSSLQEAQKAYQKLQEMFNQGRCTVLVNPTVDRDKNEKALVVIVQSG